MVPSLTVKGTTTEPDAFDCLFHLSAAGGSAYVCHPQGGVAYISADGSASFSGCTFVDNEAVGAFSLTAVVSILTCAIVDDAPPQDEVRLAIDAE